MWIRLRFDIGSGDILTGMLACCTPLRRQVLEQEAESHWSHDGRAVVCLSVRSGFDLLLSVLRLPPKSEVLLSAVTVPDMQRIVRHHGLVPLPIDLIPDGCTPSLESMQRAVTPSTRVLVIAHLFGTRVNMEAILQVARRHNLFVIEDCAQAYHGSEYRGHPESDASLFSFGPIKTATALGGGVICLQSAQLAQRLRATQHSYDVQSRRSYFVRLAKYALFRTLALRPPIELIARSCRLLGVDLDMLVAGAARNFPSADLLRHLRKQPSAPLLKMLLRRWRGYDPQRLQRRVELGKELEVQLPDPLLLDNRQVTANNYWVFPVLVDDPIGIVNSMRSRGWDATRRSRLCVMAPPANRMDLEPKNATSTMARTVFLPCYPEIPPRVLACMAKLLREKRQSVTPSVTPESAETAQLAAPISTPHGTSSVGPVAH
jgi:dTDP-4-amino-4,6-dideoxygalactose transaminase